MPNENQHFYEFGTFRIDLEERRLLQNDQPINLPPKTFELLLFLVERDNKIIEKDVLMLEVWKDTFVEEANIHVHISTLRKIFARESDSSVNIETFRKRGYRLIADVRKGSGNVTFPIDLANSENTDVEERQEKKKPVKISNAEIVEQTVIRETFQKQTVPTSKKKSYSNPIKGGNKGILLVFVVGLIVVLGGIYLFFIFL